MTATARLEEEEEKALEEAVRAISEHAPSADVGEMSTQVEKSLNGEAESVDNIPPVPEGSTNDPKSTATATTLATLSIESIPRSLVITKCTGLPSSPVTVAHSPVLEAVPVPDIAMSGDQPMGGLLESAGDTLNGICMGAFVLHFCTY